METQENDSLVVEAEPSTSAPDGDDPLRQSSEVLARGLSSMLSSVITDFDCRANQTLRSQDHLSSVLDRLTGGGSSVPTESYSLLANSLVPDPKFCEQCGVEFIDSRIQLDQLLEDAPLPFIMQHAAKISSVRKRVSSLNSLLKSIQGRIDNIDRMISFGTAHDHKDHGCSGLIRKVVSIHCMLKSASRATEDFDNPISDDIYCSLS
ncbi:uncharacterized protein HKW66_Vig0206960 [Vigna angularis]|uniref:Biogenesis of lysosome-related organelles complex 1 subunit 7 n=1 Tax=Phaseolus angularis TaxID=3914 RepID=A0A8T0JJF1_PHAAN|nr:uncharacterized protein HKW66_Vig0206960 [Vigna angularis]